MGKILALLGIIVMGYGWLWLYSTTDFQGLFLLGSVVTAALGCGCGIGEKDHG